VTIGAYDDALNGILRWLEGLEGHVWAGEEGEGRGEGHAHDDDMGRHCLDDVVHPLACHVVIRPCVVVVRPCIIVVRPCVLVVCQSLVVATSPLATWLLLLV
jgi:hypothetical protein